MMHAYQEMYLSNAQSLLGDAFDYAINSCEIPGSDFFKLFVVSSASKRMENGEPASISGKSGVETAMLILNETRDEMSCAEPMTGFARSKEYWMGWALAYYQWYSGRRFSEILNVLRYDDLDRMYDTLHEADVSKFAEIAESLVTVKYPDTNLKRLRLRCGLTQAELANRSGVQLRSIQMYEQRNKNINKACADTLYRLARTLGCTMEDLIERG